MLKLRKVAVPRWETVQAEQIEDYWRRLRDAGLDPVDFNAPGLNLDGCAGLVLTGGVDIDPALYGAERHARTQKSLRDRDEFEASLLAEALRRDLPVLAICRGHQLLNVCLGGSLLQHIESSEHEAQRGEGRPSRAHVVTTQPETPRHELFGKERFEVNSRHHQAVTPERLAPGLRITVTSEDGLVEAVESESHSWVVGVQWHPERIEPAIAGFEVLSRGIFEAFAAAISAH